MKSTIVLLCVLVLAACSIRDFRDAPWDPRPGSGETLLDQIPNMEGEAMTKCGGHMQPEDAEREGRSLRC